MALIMSDSSSVVDRRSVFLIGGYEPKSSDAFFKRTKRELSRFCDTWGVQAEMSEQTLSEDNLVATAGVETAIHGRSVHSQIHFFVWNDIVLSDFARPMVVRVARYLMAFVDYLLTGTFFRMVRSAWRFSLYFLYPVLMLTVFSTLSILMGAFVATIAPVWVATIVAVALLYGLLRWSGRRWFVLHLMDLWSFSREHLRGWRPEAEAHIERFADAVASRARLDLDDEIVLVGHSTGGALALEIAAAALARYPQLGCTGPRFTVLTIGSTALKIGLHPAAKRFRQRVQTLVDAAGVNWIECQAHTDIINFYKTDPVAAMQLPTHRPHDFPQVHLVRVREMLQPETYKRFRYNLFRVHYQFVMANTQQYAYDFFMMCCGDRLFAESLGQSLRFRPDSQSRPAESSGTVQETTDGQVPVRRALRYGSGGTY